MRFRVSAFAIRLASKVDASRIVLRLSYDKLQLALGIISVKLSVAVGLFIKFIRLNDQAIADDQQIVRDTTRVITPDVFSATDFPIRLTNKELAHGAGLDDGSPYFAEDYIVGAPDTQDYTFDSQIFFSVSKPFSNAIEIISQPVITAGKTFTDIAGVVISAPIFSFTKVVSDNVTVNDEVDGSVSGADVELEFFKSTDNTPAVTDLPEKTFITSRFEQILASDAPQITISLPRSEAISITDVEVLGISSVYSETPSVDDVGFLYSQGYTVDMTYFAEDYVGESRTFS